MKINVYFESNGKNMLLGNVDSFSKANKLMNEKIKEINFKSYYTRVNFETDNKVWIDFGSHTKFFNLELEDSNATFWKLYQDSACIATLKTILEKNVNSSIYSIYSFRDEAFCLEEDGDNYITYVGEKGNKFDIEVHSDVIDACKTMISNVSDSDEEENKILSEFMEKIK